MEKIIALLTSSIVVFWAWTHWPSSPAADPSVPSGSDPTELRAP